MNEMMKYIINLIVFVPFTIVLIIITMKLNKSVFLDAGMKKYVKVLERTSLNKNTELFVLKIGDEGCVLVSSPSDNYKIKELSEEEIKSIEHKYEEAKNKNNNLKLKFKDIDLKQKLKEIKNGRFSSNNSQ